MPEPKLSARDSAKWSEGSYLWLDHATLVESDLHWVAKARSATFWNVKYSAGFLAQLPQLESLDVRGGSGENADFVSECKSLRFLKINQVRGLSDLSAVSTAVGLEYLCLYGLPKVTRLPSLSELAKLDRVELGSMKGVEGISGVLQAPALSELVLIRKVGVSLADAAAIAAHPSINKFSWFAEDVPDRTWVPFVERVGKPGALWDWWERRAV